MLFWIALTVILLFTGTIVFALGYVIDRKFLKPPIGQTRIFRAILAATPVCTAFWLMLIAIFDPTPNYIGALIGLGIFGYIGALILAIFRWLWVRRKAKKSETVLENMFR